MRIQIAFLFISLIVNVRIYEKTRSFVFFFCLRTACWFVKSHYANKRLWYSVTFFLTKKKHITRFFTLHFSVAIVNFALGCHVRKFSNLFSHCFSTLPANFPKKFLSVQNLQRFRLLPEFWDTRYKMPLGFCHLKVETSQKL